MKVSVSGGEALSRAYHELIYTRHDTRPCNVYIMIGRPRVLPMQSIHVQPSCSMFSGWQIRKRDACGRVRGHGEITRSTILCYITFTISRLRTRRCTAFSSPLLSPSQYLGGTYSTGRDRLHSAMSSYKRGGSSFRGGSGSRGNTRFTGKKRRGGAAGGGGGGVAYGIDRPAPVREDDGSASAERFEEVRIWDEIDSKLGFERFESGSYEGEKRAGWLVNMHQVRVILPTLAAGSVACEDSAVLLRLEEGESMLMPDVGQFDDSSWRDCGGGLLLYPRRWRHVQGDDTARAVLLHHV